MIRKSALAAAIAALLTPAVAGALGLGNIEVSSALNEPLQARIPLRGADATEIAELRAALGSDEQFQRAGLDRVFVLTKLKFEVVEASAGRGFIRITSREPISEPFLNFLVDVNWPRGRMLREYTVLLDPPVYGAAISTAAKRAVKTVATMPEAGSSAAAPPPATQRATPAPAAPARSAPAMAPSSAPRYSGDSYGPVRAGETLWSIADRTRAGGVSIQNMMLALLRANPQAFSFENVNALRTGAVLRIPAASEIQGDKAQALAEVARHHGLWNEYRQNLPGALARQPGGAAPAAAAAPGQAPSAATPSTPAPGAQPSGSQLKVVGGATSGTAAGAGAEVQSLRNELTMAQEEAEASKRENDELKSRLSEVEGVVGDLRRLVELKEDQLAALQNQLSQTQAAAPVAPSAEKPAAMPAETPQVPAQKPATTPAEKVTPVPEKKPEMATPPAKPGPRPVAPPPAPAPTSFIDEIAQVLPVPLWSVLAGLGALVFGFGAFRWSRGRKAKAAAAAGAVGGAAAMAEGGSMIDQYARTELPADGEEEDVTEMPSGVSPDAETLVDDDEDKTQFTGPTGEPSAATSTGPGEDDPLAEVNVYLAYERFDQAEQLVRDAIQTYPERQDYLLKLLEVFYAAKNAAGFETAARDLQDAVGNDHEMMQQARGWWQDLGAGRDLFDTDDGPSTAEGPASAPAGEDDLFDVTAADAGDQTGVDFDLGFESAEQGQASGGVDFDLGDSGVGGEAGADSGGLDFDLGDLGVDEAAAADAAPGGTDLDFDLSGDEEPAAASGSGGTDLDFDLGDSGDTAAPEAPAKAAQDAGSDSLDFDLGADDAEDVAEGETRPLPERAGESGDAGLDFDLGGLDDVADQPASTAEDATAEASLDFNLDDGATGEDAPERGGDAGEAALDFDLSDTASLDDLAAAEAGAGEADDGLDLDLGAGAEDESSPDLSQTATDAGDGELESGLDFDLGDTGGPAIEPVAGVDDGLSLDLDLDTGTGDSTQQSGDTASLDLDLDDGGEPIPQSTSGFQDARTEVSDGLDLDLSLSVDDASTAGGQSDSGEVDFPLLDMGSDDEGSPAIDTVQLSAEDASAMRALGGIDQDDGDSKEDGGLGVDTEFRDIFATGGEQEAGAGSVLDFDLGADLGDQTPGAGDDLADTQFMLRDMGRPDDEDEDDRTLVLGRGGSGEVDEMQTKLDLAQAYMDMGDTEGARNLLGEVMADGSDPQKDQARDLLTKLS